MIRKVSEESIIDAAASKPRCLSIATRGIRTDGDFAQMMSAMMSDLVEGNITPAVGNAMSRAGGNLLKIVELRLKYGQPTKDGLQKELQLVNSNDSSQDSNITELARLDAMQEELNARRRQLNSM